MNGYVAFWNRKRVEVYAENKYAAILKAKKEFEKSAGRRAVKPYDIAAILAEKDGEPVIHNPSILEN